MTDKLKKLMQKNGVQDIKRPNQIKELEAKIDNLIGDNSSGISNAERIEALEAAILEIAEEMGNNG